MDIIALPHDDILFPCILSYLSVEELFKLRLVSTSYRDVVDHFFVRCSDIDFSKSHLDQETVTTLLVFKVIATSVYHSEVNKQGNANAFRLMTDGNTVLLRLCLSGATHWLTDELLLPVIKSCNALAEIDLSQCSQLTNRSLFALATYCNSITSISLQGCHWVDQENFKLLIANNPRLKSVDVSSCWSLNDECICFCAQSCHKLKVLQLTNIYAITDLSLTTIARCCPKLTTLAVNGCWRVTNDGIRTIGEYCNKLHSLNVSDCRDVTEASLARLRVRGIEIDVQPTPSGNLHGLETSFRHTRPFINLQI